MQRIIFVWFLTALYCGFSPVPVFSETRADNVGEPDSEYVEKGRKAEREEDRGLLDFLPFVGRRAKSVEPEKLDPSPLPRESKPVLLEHEMEELKVVAGQWLLTSDVTEPKVRQDAIGRYYRHYIVFASEYRIDVLRGDTEERPFIAHVYVEGDYFKTEPRADLSAAESDYDFKYEKMDFRLIFEREEEWEYSDNPNEEPFAFREEWKFRKLQSRPKVDISEEVGVPGEDRGDTFEQGSE